MMPNNSCSKAIAEANPRSSESQLTQQPTEIILLIAENLPNISALCLALTCKSLFVLLGSEDRVRLEPFDRKAFLCYLEKDVPGVFYCHFCKILKRFNESAKLTTLFSPDLALSGPRFTRLDKCGPLDTLAFEGTLLYLPYNHARLITNYGRFGPRHGFHPSYLSFESPMLTRGSGRFREVWSGRLIDYELFLSSTHMLYDENADALQKLITTVPFYICQHTTVGHYTWRKSHHIDLSLINTNQATNSYSHESGSCSSCLTDWDVSFEYVSREHGWVVKIVTYHNLGGCRSPLDPKWQAMVDIYGPKFHRDVPRGGVKHNWIRDF